MDKSRSNKSAKKSVSIKNSGSRENRVKAISERRNFDKIDEDPSVCQTHIVNAINRRDVLEKTLGLLITAREKILLYDDHAEYARRRLKEAREAIYLMDVDDINLAAEFEEKIQAAIRRLAELDDDPMRFEHKTELSHRIGEIEKIIRSMQRRNDIVYEALKKKMASFVKSRRKIMTQCNRPLATRNSTNDDN